VSLNFVRHAKHLEEIIVEGAFQVVYFDQVLDHLDSALNSHTQHDVRAALAPLRSIARRREVCVIYTMHPNKIGGQASVRDRSGGSGQFTDLTRSALFLGYHPDREGWRAVARGKGNAGVVPPALTFRIEGTFAVNPKTRDVVETAKVVDLEEDPHLRADEILPHEPRRGEETAADKLNRIAQTVGADGEWHARKELADACAAEGVQGSTFTHGFLDLTTIVRETHRGRESQWRIK